MSRIETLGPERLMLSFHGAETVSILVRDPQFGSIASVRMSRDQGAELAGRLMTMLLDGPDPERRSSRDQGLADAG